MRKYNISTCYYTDILSEEPDDKKLFLFPACFTISMRTSVLSRDILLAWAEEAITGVCR